MALALGTMDAIDKRVVWGVIEPCGLYPAFLFSAVVLYFLKTNALVFITGSMTMEQSFNVLSGRDRCSPRSS